MLSSEKDKRNTAETREFS